MAPAGKKKKACCDLFNPMGMFKDDEYERVSDDEKEGVADHQESSAGKPYELTPLWRLVQHRHVLRT